MAHGDYAKFSHDHSTNSISYHIGMCSGLSVTQTQINRTIV